MEYYAHSDCKRDQSQWHLLKKHLEDTGEMSGDFAACFKAEKIGYVAGLLHDIGKYSYEFQQHLLGIKNRVDHSSAGAIEAVKNYKTIGRILAYVIAGHHSGIPDWGSKADEGSLEARLAKKSLPDYSAFQNDIIMPKLEELDFPIKKAHVGYGFSVYFFIRFLYSSLVDADFLDTERALNIERSMKRYNEVSLEEILHVLDDFLERKCRNASNTPINMNRARILACCREKSIQKPGLFTLTVPTGGGKTLSSMAFALKHAIVNGMRRVIYVIPYTSIIEQNAAIFRDLFGENIVLEHHSNILHYDDTDGETESISANVKLASENWDMPIVFTTNVQFFESLFASKSSRCRKLHNIVGSIIIIDEAQMIPTDFLLPCINALVELVTNYNTTIVLCTATQPAINTFLPPEIKPIEIIDEPQKLYSDFKRVEINHLGELHDDLLAKKLQSEKQVLCIVNSKKHARVLYEMIRKEGSYHLSTRMCAVHRSHVLRLIKARLRNAETCRVVSTQLIEAGVDIDFPVVFRSSAGIDSIAQSAGRCNREGIREKGTVFVFRPERHGLPSGWLSRTASIGEEVFRRVADPISLEGVNEYFQQLYNIEGERLDKKGIMTDIKEQQKQLKFPFRSIANKFKLIDENTTSIVIPYDDECKFLIEKTMYSEFPRKFIRKLQRYSVQVYESEFRDMLRLGIIRDIAGIFVLSDEGYHHNYSLEMGLLPCTESMLLKDTMLI